jgi:hypothetical protein
MPRRAQPNRRAVLRKPAKRSKRSAADLPRRANKNPPRRQPGGLNFFASKRSADMQDSIAHDARNKTQKPSKRPRKNKSRYLSFAAMRRLLDGIDARLGNATTTPPLGAGEVAQ